MRRLLELSERSQSAFGRASAQSHDRRPGTSAVLCASDLPAHDGREDLAAAPDRDLGRKAADLAPVLPLAPAVRADPDLPVAVDAVQRVLARPGQPRAERRV